MQKRFEMMRKRGVRKAQITMFVILGAVLLIIFLMLYLFLSGKMNIRGGPRATSEAVPAEFKPVQNYVEGCIHKLSIEAVKKIGAHGGYIDPFDADLTPVHLRFSSLRPTRYELASLTGDYSSAVPYYLFVPGDASYYNYEMGSAAPTLESIEYQLNVYISRELPGCVGGFEELVAQGFEITPDNTNIITTTHIRDDVIEMTVKYPIDASKEGVKTKISGYTDTLRFPFMKYYELAMGVMATELFTQFLESFTTNLIDYHSGVSFSLLPPPIEYTNAPYVITWSNAKVRLDMDSLLQSYVPALQVMNTSGYTPVEMEGADEVEQNFYKSLSMNIFDGNISESITFFYVPGTLTMKVQPSKGDAIRPSIAVKKGNQFIPQSEFNTYKFFYDISYPVIVEIRGYEPMTDILEYSYIFALEANIIENKAALAWNMGMGTVEWDHSYINVTITVPDEALTDEEGAPITLPPRSMAKSLFCDEDAWMSGEASITVQEEITTNPIPEATISYGCGDYQECFVGSTDGQGEWRGKLPLCIGGYLSVVKEGYGAKNLMLTTQEGVPATIGTQRLYRIKEINATVKKFEIQKIFTRDDWEWEAGPDTLGLEQDINPETEQVILTINQVGFEAGNNPISATMIFGVDGEEIIPIKLAPGEYEVTANLIDYEGINIPAGCSRVCSSRGFLGIGCDEHTYFPDPAIEMEQAPWGGVDITRENIGAFGTFAITSGDLEGATEIEFRVIRLPNLQYSNPPGACIIAMDEMGKVAEYSSKYSSELTPRLR